MPAEGAAACPPMQAAQHGHTAALEALLGAGAEVDSTFPGGWTALLFAAQTGPGGAPARPLKGAPSQPQTAD